MTESPSLTIKENRTRDRRGDAVLTLRGVDPGSRELPFLIRREYEHPGYLGTTGWQDAKSVLAPAATEIEGSGVINLEIDRNLARFIAPGEMVIVEFPTIGQCFKRIWPGFHFVIDQSSVPEPELGLRPEPPPEPAPESKPKLEPSAEVNNDRRDRKKVAVESETIFRLTPPPAEPRRSRTLVEQSVPVPTVARSHRKRLHWWGRLLWGAVFVAVIGAGGYAAWRHDAVALARLTVNQLLVMASNWRESLPRLPEPPWLQAAPTPPLPKTIDLFALLAVPEQSPHGIPAVTVTDGYTRALSALAAKDDPQRFAEAGYWLARAARGNDGRLKAGPIVYLANLYADGGFGLDRNIESAGLLWQLAATLADPVQSRIAMMNLGDLYAGILGEARGNLESARTWYRRAKEAGHPDADAALERLAAY